LHARARARRADQARLGARQLRQPRRVREADGARHAARVRGDQRRRGTPRPQDPGRPVRHPVRHRALHQVRAAARARRQGRRRPRRHHVGLARGDPADVPAQQRALLLQRALRGWRLRPQLLRHRHDPGTGGRADRRDLAEAVGQEGLRAGRRLQLRPDHGEVGRALCQAARRLGAADRLLPARRRRLRLDDRQDPGRQARLGLRGARRRRAPVVLPPVGGIGDEQEDPALLDDLRRRQRAPRALARRRRRHPDRRQLQPGRSVAGEQGLPRALGQALRRHQDRPRDRGFAIPGHQALGRGRDQGRLARPRQADEGARVGDQHPGTCGPRQDGPGHAPRFARHQGDGGQGPEADDQAGVQPTPAERHRGVVQPRQEPEREQAVRGDDLSPTRPLTRAQSPLDYAAVVFLEILYMIAFLALISAGLAVVFGMMRVINLAHGEFVMIGGYTTIFANRAGVDIWFAMLVLAPLVVGAIGVIVERIVIRHLYGRMIDTMLATWGLSLLMVGLVTLVFGNTAVSVPAPIQSYQVGAYQMGGYNLFIIAIAILLVLVLWLVLRHTRIGLIARGAMQNADVASSLGHNPQRIYMWTFTAGAALSGLAGGVMAPLTGLLPSSGSLYIAKAFITVITGGAAIVSGTLASSVIFGTINQIVSFGSTPVIGEIAMLALAIILLRLMPQGITGRFFRNST